MLRYCGSFIVSLFMISCANRAANPTIPQIDGQQGVGTEQADATASPIPNPNQGGEPVSNDQRDTQELAIDPSENSGLSELTVIPKDQLPPKILDCVQLGFAGEVLDGNYSCNTIALIDCSQLSSAQKSAAKGFLDTELAGYQLYGCSLVSEDAVAFHFFVSEGDPPLLKIFTLEVQNSQP